MIKKTILLIALLSALRGALSQPPDCSALEEDTGGLGIQPAIVRDLPVCESLRNRSQCCTRDYLLERVEQTRDSLVEGIRAQIQVRREKFENITTELSDFVEGTFLERFFNAMDVGFARDRTSVFGNLLAELRDRFEIGKMEEDEEEDQDDDESEAFSVRNFFNRVVDRIRDEAVMEFNGVANRAQCIRRVIDEAVDNSKMDIVSGHIQRLRQVVSTLQRIARFFREFEEGDLAGFRPLERCVTRLTDLLYCGRCVEITPPLCHNICGALAKGCYSPVYGGLRRQFQRILTVSRRVLEVARDAVQQLNRSRNIVDLDRETLIMELREECNITAAPIGDRMGRQADSDGNEGDTSDEGDDDSMLPTIPDYIQDMADSLRGVFEYGDKGPLLCVSTAIRTQKQNCWDGEGIRMRDITRFEGNDINDQSNNPAIMLELEELEAQSAELIENSPASALLSDPAFVEIVPEGVDLTDPDEQTGGGAASLAVSSVTLLLLLTLAFSVAAY